MSQCPYCGADILKEGYNQDNLPTNTEASKNIEGIIISCSKCNNVLGILPIIHKQHRSLVNLTN